MNLEINFKTKNRFIHLFFWLFILVMLIVFTLYYFNYSYAKFLILVYIVAIILTFCLWKNLTTQIDNNLLRFYLAGTFSALVIFIGLFYLDYAEGINTNLDFGNYEFEIRVQPSQNTVLNNFLIYYNFKEDDGNIFFTTRLINNTQNPEYIMIRIPSELKFDKIRIFNESIVLEENKNYYKEIHNFSDYNLLVLKSFNKSLESKNFNITLNGFIMPNGLFIIYSNSWRTYSNLYFVIFHLGNYQRKANCFERLDAIYDLRGNILSINYPQDYYPEGSISKDLFNRISLNTDDQDLIANKNLSYNLGVSFLIGGILLFLEFAIIYVDYYLELRKPICKKCNRIFKNLTNLKIHKSKKRH